MDLLTAASGILSFSIFLIIHLVSFRWVRSEHLLKALLGTVLALMVFPIIVMGILFFFNAVDAGILTWACATVLAVLVFGLLCFVYIICIFGPYETSVRMRLVREIAKGGMEGILPEELLARYNAKTIVDIRLQRLLGAGDIVEKNGKYRVLRDQNVFYVFDAIAGVIKKWIGR